MRMIKKSYSLLLTLTVVIIAVSLVKGIGLASADVKFPEGETAEITELTAQDWTESEDGTGMFYTIPEDASAAQVLEITSNWISMEIYLEDTLLYSFDDEYQELGRIAHWIEIPEGSSGKRLIFISDSDTASVEKTLQSGNYLGTADAIRHHFFMKNLPVLLLTVVDAMMAGIVILIMIVLRRKLSVKLIQGMWDLLFFIMLNGIWLLSDSGFLECFTAKTGLWALISYIAFMLMPVFMVRFTQRLLTYRRKSLHILGMASLGLTSVTLFLYLTRFASLGLLLVLHQALMVLDFAVVFFLCNYEIRRYRIRRLTPVRVGVALMGIFAASTILAYWKGLNTLYPLLYGTGFTCYIVCLTISVVRQSYYNLGKKAEMDTYRELAYKDAMTMIYNRSAFMKYQKGAGANTWKSAYVLFDINNLKLVNDTKGHHAGDDLIVRAAACIRETFDEAGSCYRIGGDEFLVVLTDIRDEEEVQSLLEHFERRVWISNKRLAEDQPPLSIAYGFSLAGEMPRSATEMYEEADKWMYKRKRKMKAADPLFGSMAMYKTTKGTRSHP